MKQKIGETIRDLRISRGISQESLAGSLGVSAQAVSKWENQKTLPDISLLPQIAAFFHVTIDALFKGVIQDEQTWLDDTHALLELNRKAWNGIADKEWTGTNLPAWGVYMAEEDTLQLLGDLTGKNVLEIACGAGKSLLYCVKRQPKELWGLDMSERQLEKARECLGAEGFEAKLILSPMEVNPGIPEQHFDLVYSIYGIGWTLDLEKTIALASKYLRTNGVFIFSWNNPLLPCIANCDGQYVLKHSYLDEMMVQKTMRGEILMKTNWKLSTYINILAKNGFLIERLVEDSTKDANAVYTDEYYSEHKAQFIHHSFVIKARKR